MQALAHNGRASGVTVAGRLRAVGNDPSCPCCEPGCPLYRRMVRCDRAGTCFGQPPAVVYAWICDTVLCTTGGPLVAGRVVIIDGICWVVESITAPTPTPGHLVVIGTDPVECVPQGCSDIRCPQESFYVLGTPCNPNQPLVYFCGVTECGIYRRSGTPWCYRVDPSSGHIPPDQLPPGAITAIGTGPFASCCDCEPACELCPMVSGAVGNNTCYGPVGPNGIPLIFSQTCCRSARACLYVTTARSSQVFTPSVGFPPLQRVENEYINLIILPNGDQTAQLRNRRYFDGIAQPEETITDIGVVGGCGLCPSFYPNPPRDRLISGFTTGIFADECIGVNNGGQPGQIDVLAWSNSWNCRSSSHLHSYRFISQVLPLRTVTTTFEFGFQVVDNDGGVCSGRCAGRALLAPPLTLSTSGCQGCLGSTIRVA